MGGSSTRYFRFGTLYAYIYDTSDNETIDGAEDALLYYNGNDGSLSIFLPPF